MASVPNFVPARLKPALAQTDVILTRLTRMLTTVAGADKVLLTLYYLLKLVHPQLARLQTSRRSSGPIKQVGAIALLPRDTIVAVLNQEARNTSRLARLETGAKSLADAISDYRLFTRLWGLLSIYTWAKATYLAPPTDYAIKMIVWTQVAMGAGFQLYENLAFLALKKVLSERWAGPSEQKRWWIWSARFWAGHLTLEALRLARVKQLEDADVANRDEKNSVKDRQSLGAWRRMWYSNAAYVPIALHYSLPGGCLSDQQQGFFGLMAGVLGLGELWQTSSKVT